MSDRPFYTFERDGKRYTFRIDESYETVGSYAYETEEETRAAEQEELSKLASYEWVALWCEVEVPCPRTFPHNPETCCSTCTGWETIDTLGGIVVENSTEATERFVEEGGI